MGATDGRGRGVGAALRRWLGREGPAELQLELERDGTWSAAVGRAGLEVRCLRGAVLVTLEGDPVDHLLSPGEAFFAGHRGRLVVWALAAARARVRSAAAAAGAAPGREGDALAAARGKGSTLGAGLIGPGRSRS